MSLLVRGISSIYHRMKSNVIKLMLLAMPILCSACNSKDDGRLTLPDDLTPGQSGEEEVQNVIANWDMEADVSMELVEEPLSDNWSYIGGWNGGAATPQQFDDRGMKGSRCLALSAEEDVDVAFAQKIKVTPGTPYKASARIKTEAVSGGAGGHLSLDYLWAPRSEAVTASKDWTYVTLEFEPETEYVTLCLKLGNTAASCSGTAYFDNVSLKVNTDLHILASEHARLVVDKSLVTVSDDVIMDWLKKLDMVYEAYIELFSGREPFDGKITTIRSASIDAWAYAGNPVQWNENYIAESLLKVKRGDWCFGLMHEFGHNFAPYISDASYSWNFNEELFANFRMYYALCKLDGVVITDASVPNGDGTYTSKEKTYVGSEIMELYKSETSNCYDRTIGAGKAVEMGNGLCYLFCRTVERYGWQMWIDTFDELYKIPRNQAEEQSMNSWQKFEMLHTYLKKHAPTNAELFTQAELNTIKAYLEAN